MQVCFCWMHKHLIHLLYGFNILPAKVKIPDFMGKKKSMRYSSSCLAFVLLRAVPSLGSFSSSVRNFKQFLMALLCSRGLRIKAVSGNLICPDNRFLTQQSFRLWLQHHYLICLSLCTQKGAATKMPLSMFFWFSFDWGSFSAWPAAEIIRLSEFCLNPYLRSCWQERLRVEHHSSFMYLICWGTEVVAAIYYLRNLVMQEISLRLRSAVFKPLYATRAIEKALGHWRKFDPLCLEALLDGILVAINKVSAKDY